ncbi:MAG: sporulation transcriptional regulator SpoIIID [Clostridia bacterium]|nr:sporulation transcriptional regulator SpoIIID [Clostridia bacterium]
MNIFVEERAVELGEYIIKSKSTVRKAAKKFGVSKSTVHKDVSQRLKYVDPQLYKRVKTVLEMNKAQRHIRGGMATKQKYMQKKIEQKVGKISL